MNNLNIKSVYRHLKCSITATRSIARSDLTFSLHVFRSFSGSTARAIVHDIMR